MFCSNCGAAAGGNFCSTCGAPLQAAAPASSAAAPAAATTVDWSQETRYETLIRISEVKEKIARHAAMAKKRMSAEDFLALSDKIIKLDIPLAKLGAIAQPIYAQLGIETGKGHMETVAAPPGTVIVRALCSLARNGQAVQRVRQSDDGCMLEAALPSDLWSWEGALYVTVRRTAEGTRVDAATAIKGQLYDWGKSRRCLDALFADLQATPA